MKKTTVNLPERLIEKLDKETDHLQISRSELLRRILDKYFGTKGGE